MSETLDNLNLLTIYGLKLVTGGLDGFNPDLVVSSINVDPHMLPLTTEELNQAFRFQLAVGLCQRRKFSGIGQTLSLAN